MTANSNAVKALKRRADSGKGVAQAFRLSRAEERRLVRAARAGDARALRRLVEMLSGPIYRFGRGFCGDPHDAEDVAQMVLMAVTRTLKDFRGDSSLTTWAYTVARNACSRYRRRGAHAPERLESLEAAGPGRGGLDVADARQDPQRDLERRELARALERAIAALPRGQREVLVLRDVEGLPAGRVAKVLRIGERAVKSRLHRARAALREALASYAGRGARAQVRGGAARRAPGDGAGGRRAAAKATRRRPAGCPDVARALSRYLEGELDVSACAQLESHVASCHDCGAVCATLRGALTACRGWRAERLPRELAHAVRQATREFLAEHEA